MHEDSRAVRKRNLLENPDLQTAAWFQGEAKFKYADFSPLKLECSRETVGEQ
jgi:hypothetical protein